MTNLSTELRKAFLAGIGAFSLSKDRVQDLIDELITTGEMKEKDAIEYVKELIERAKGEREALQKSIREEAEKVVHSMGVVTKADFEKMNDKLKRLERAAKKKR